MMKLNHLLSSNRDNERLNYKFKRFAVRHGILTSTGGIATIICPLIWINTGFSSTLYLGVWINIISMIAVSTAVSYIVLEADGNLIEQLLTRLKYRRKLY